MKLEVTQKEAWGIYSQRYLDMQGGDKFFYFKIFPIFAIAIIVGVYLLENVNDWLGVATLVLLASPAVFLVLRQTKRSGKYARDQIMGNHPEEILDMEKIAG